MRLPDTKRKTPICHRRNVLCSNWFDNALYIKMHHELTREEVSCPQEGQTGRYGPARLGMTVSLPVRKCLVVVAHLHDVLP